MSDLVEFLAARLDQREAFAKACLVGARPDMDKPGKWAAYIEGGDDGWAFEACDGTGFGGIVEHEPVARHIEINDPAYVLRDVAAKRTLIRIYQHAVSELNHHCEVVERASLPPVRGLDAFIAEMHRADAAVREWKSVLEVHATVYNDHPDYDKAWSLPD